MGYSVSRFFIIHSWERGPVEQAHALATASFGALVGPIMTASVNWDFGFIVWTSGSQNGWPETQKHDEKIELLIAEMSGLEHPPRWVIVGSGEEPGDMDLEQGSDGNYNHHYKRFELSRGAEED